jgi:hypothetical protein
VTTVILTIPAKRVAVQKKKDEQAKDGKIANLSDYKK